MCKVRLVTPSPKFLTPYLEACRESFHRVPHPYILHDPARFDEWKNTIFERYKKDASGLDLPTGYVPSTTLFVTDASEREYLGTVNVRHHLNYELTEYGGHVGVFVRERWRGRGIGRAATIEGIRLAGELGEAEGLLTCLAGNAASAKVLRGLPGARLEENRAVVEGVYSAILKAWVKPEDLKN